MLIQRVKRKLKRFTAGLLSMSMILTMIPEIWLPIYAENVSQDIMNAEITTVSEITEEPVSNETMTSNSESEETDNNINTDISETETSENSDNIEASTEETTAVIDNNYAIFSGSSSQGLNLYGWKSFFTGNIYTGNIFNYGGSELYITGKVDAVSAIVSNGWITEIAETKSMWRLFLCLIMTRLSIPMRSLVNITKRVLHIYRIRQY